MLLQEQEELWLQDSKKFWSIITSRDKPNHLRYTGHLKGSRARKALSKKPLPRGQDVYISLLPLDRVGKSSNNITCFNMLWVDLDFNSCYEMFDSGAEEKLQKLREPPNIIVFSGKGLWALWKICM